MNLGNFVGSNSFLNRPNVVPGVERYSSAYLNGTWDPNAPEATAPGSISMLGTQRRLLLVRRSYGNIRMPNYLNEDISIIKKTNVNERVSIQFRVDFLNMFNRVIFGSDQGGDQYDLPFLSNAVDWGIGGFGHISVQGNFPREIQFGLKINY